MSTDWLPRARAEQLGMAGNWINLIAIHGERWNIPSQVNSELKDLADIARDTLNDAMSSGRTTTITALCAAAFGKLEAFMRLTKRRFFWVPNVTEVDLISLGLKPPPITKSEIAVPTGSASGSCELTVAHHLTVVWEILRASHDPRSDKGVRIHYGVVVDDPVKHSALTGKQYYIGAPPRNPEQLTENFFTRRKKKTISFPYEDSGKTAWFCLRLENDKGDRGPWGEMFQAVIP